MTTEAGGKEGGRHLSSLDSIIHKQSKKTVRYVTKQQAPEISNTYSYREENANYVYR